MDDNFDALVIDVRASTDGFAADLETMRRSLDTSLLDGFGRAGNVLENGLLSALRRGSLGFDDLKRVAFRALDEIASHALQSGLANLFGGSGTGGLGGLIGQSLGALFGLPGRATGGPVSPGRAYLVGENGPELFIPQASGRIANNAEVRGMGRGGATINISVEGQVDMRSRQQLAADVGRASQKSIARTY